MLFSRAQKNSLICRKIARDRTRTPHIWCSNHIFHPSGMDRGGDHLDGGTHQEALTMELPHRVRICLYRVTSDHWNCRSGDEYHDPRLRILAAMIVKAK